MVFNSFQFIYCLNFKIPKYTFFVIKINYTRELKTSRFKYLTTQLSWIRLKQVP